MFGGSRNKIIGRYFVGDFHEMKWNEMIKFCFDILLINYTERIAFFGCLTFCAIELLITLNGIFSHSKILNGEEWKMEKYVCVVDATN